MGRFPTCYSPVRHCIRRYRSTRWAGSLRVTHPFATVSEDTVRLACIRHAASVHPEPGSNSPFEIDSKLSLCFMLNDFSKGELTAAFQRRKQLLYLVCFDLYHLVLVHTVCKYIKERIACEELTVLHKACFSYHSILTESSRYVKYF